MKNENLPELFKKYLRGECTPEESAVIDSWYLSHEQNPDDVRLHDILEQEKLEAKMLDRIKSNVITNPSHNFTLANPVSSFSPWVYRVAASILVVTGAGIAAFFLQNEQLSDVKNQTVSVNATKKLRNNTSSLIHHLLSDGTTIELQPNGSIVFPEVFSEATREIQLTGEAFFDVAKDKKRPFIISTEEVAIRVLGTSFNVKAYQGAKEVTVAVKTGKVSVYAKTIDRQTSDGTTAEEIILTPNQEVIYNTIDENFLRKLVEVPQIILARPTLFEMQYDATPVDKIFEVMEENYGIDIVFDEEILSGCNLTTSLAEEGFYERIEIICQAIGARYEISDGKILVHGTGCH